jgi:hypothetical protein
MAGCAVELCFLGRGSIILRLHRDQSYTGCQQGEYQSNQQSFNS